MSDIFAFKKCIRDSKQATHPAKLVRLVKSSMEHHVTVCSINFTKKTLAGIRQEARDIVKEELKEIDNIVSRFLWSR